jgi:hypothetical protein
MLTLKKAEASSNDALKHPKLEIDGIKQTEILSSLHGTILWGWSFVVICLSFVVYK